MRKIKEHFFSCQVVAQCCEEEEDEEEADPRLALERLVSRVKEGQLSEGAVLRLFRALQHKAAIPSPLLALVEEVERNSQRPDGNQTGGKEWLCEYVSGLSSLKVYVLLVIKAMWPYLSSYRDDNDNVFHS